MGTRRNSARPRQRRSLSSLSKTHSSFETPCGSYAHFKLTRYLLRATRNSLYGDSMERVMYNTILGAKPLQPDGRTFYYSDYNFSGKKVYKDASLAMLLRHHAANHRRLLDQRLLPRSRQRLRQSLHSFHAAMDSGCAQFS